MQAGSYRCNQHNDSSSSVLTLYCGGMRMCSRVETFSSMCNISSCLENYIPSCVCNHNCACFNCTLTHMHTRVHTHTHTHTHTHEHTHKHTQTRTHARTHVHTHIHTHTHAHTHTHTHTHTHSHWHSRQGSGRPRLHQLGNLHGSSLCSKVHGRPPLVISSPHVAATLHQSMHSIQTPTLGWAWSRGGEWCG